ncbi:MAG: DUF3179 domain-containing protein [Spirochaetota bacterium]
MKMQHLATAFGAVMALTLLLGCAGNPDESGNAGGGRHSAAGARRDRGASAEGRGHAGNGGANGGVVEVDFQGGPAGPDYQDPRLPPEFHDQKPPSSAGQFDTDFSRATISYADVISGGPPKDGIPSVDNPRFVSVEEADEWIGDNESVLVITQEGKTHIHPIQILMWHEIVNDVIGGVPVAVTYCPLCNTGVAFLRNFDGRTLDFGVSGMLRFSNMIMYDRQTETWWQQADGRGVAGRYAGGKLHVLPLLMLPWNEAVAEYPEAQVVSRDTGYARSYGRNPYAGYDRASRPFLYRGPEINGEFDPMTRVVTLELGGESEGYPYPVLRNERVVNDTVGGESVVVIWQPGTASPLDSGSVAGGRDIGTANAFSSTLDGRSLTFEWQGERIVDAETESVWNVNGRAVGGELEGSRLEALPQVQHFWFSWTAFEPGER